MTLEDIASAAQEADRFNAGLEKISDKITLDHFRSLENNPIMELHRYVLGGTLQDLERVAFDPMAPRDLRLDCIGRISGIREFDRLLELSKNAVQAKEVQKQQQQEGTAQ